MAKQTEGILESIKSLSIIFVIGVAWARMEYKSDKQYQEIKEVLSVYVANNEKDKEMLTYKIGELRNQVDVNTLTIKTITEFVKPEDVRRRRYEK